LQNVFKAGADISPKINSSLIPRSWKADPGMLGWHAIGQMPFFFRVPQKMCSESFVYVFREKSQLPLAEPGEDM
jgi:hypothetical protein